MTNMPDDDFEALKIQRDIYFEKQRERDKYNNIFFYRILFCLAGVPISLVLIAFVILKIL